MNSVIKDIIGSSTLNTYGAVSFAKDRYRNIKSSLFLNGSNATMSDFDSGNGFTIMLWFKLQDTSTVSLIQCLSNNVLAFTVNFGYSTDYPAIDLVTSNETKSYDMTNDIGSDNKWFHMTVTVDPINILLFINGVNVGQMKSETLKSTLSCAIGKDINNSSYAEFKGYIDEVKVFRAPIDQYAIKTIHKDMKETNIDKLWIRKFVATSKLIC
jgi:hypothetical protein